MACMVILNGKNMEMKGLQNSIETLQDKIEDIRNIIQILEISMQNTEEDEHIIRSVSVIDKMLDNVLQVDMKELIQIANGYKER